MRQIRLRDTVHLVLEFIDMEDEDRQKVFQAGVEVKSRSPSKMRRCGLRARHLTRSE